MRQFFNIRLGQNSTSFHDKSSEETKNERNIPQHYQGYIQQTYKQLYSEWGKIKLFPLKSGMK
jgi:hypothetical protein